MIHQQKLPKQTIYSLSNKTSSKPTQKQSIQLQTNLNEPNKRLHDGKYNIFKNLSQQRTLLNRTQEQFNVENTTTKLNNNMALPRFSTNNSYVERQKTEVFIKI